MRWLASVLFMNSIYIAASEIQPLDYQFTALTTAL